MKVSEVEHQQKHLVHFTHLNISIHYRQELCGNMTFPKEENDIEYQCLK